LVAKILKNLLLNLKTKKMKYTSTLSDLKKILINLKKQNDPKDYQLIKFYENKINTETQKILNKLTN
jgi:hypothetical protein